MNELQKTAVMALAAVVLVALAALMTPRAPDPPQLRESGQPFYPEFKDPLSACAIEIVTLDEATATRKPFKVALAAGRWVIPSKYNHPADARERLGKTAGALIDLRKDAVRSDNPKDYETLGVIDPAEDGTGIKGNGIRVTLRSKDGKVLCDFIFGREVKGKTGFRYCRVPGGKRVYEVKLTYEPSAKFADWVETDLLKVDTAEVRKITLDTYTFDTDRGELRDRQVNELKKGDGGGTWTLDAITPEEEINAAAAGELEKTLDDLRIVDVRKKPDGMAARFLATGPIRVSRGELGGLLDKGFYPADDLLAKYGELALACADGVGHPPWFGAGAAAGEAEGGGEWEP